MGLDFEHLTVERTGAVEHVTLNRPGVRNALNDTLVSELTAWAEARQVGDGVRVVVLQGAGASFCAGADIAYMARTLEFTADENVAAARAMAAAFRALDALPVPLIGRIHGAALGGGAGLAAVCDIVVAADDAVFGFTEVKLGILPAVIAPYVLAKIGPSAARHLFLTGARFPALEARNIGLVHHVVPTSDLDAAVATAVGHILAAAPTAIARAKQLISTLASSGRSDFDAVVDETTRAIAEQRVSDEGQEGLRAFLDKRPPRWVE